MRILRNILKICLVLLFSASGGHLFAQIKGSPANDKNAIDYRYQIFENRLIRYNTDSTKFRNRIYTVYSAGIEANWEQFKTLNSAPLGFNAKFSLGFNITPIHAIEAEFIYANLGKRTNLGGNLNYVFNINNFATNQDNFNKLEVLLLVGGSYRHTAQHHYGANAGLRIQYNPGINCGLFIEPKLTILSTDKSQGSIASIPSVNMGLTMRFHKPNYYLWDYLTPIAIKTNLLYDALTAVNIGIEAPIGNRWSVVAEWMSPWWSSYDKQLYFQIMNGNVEGRYWFGERTNRLKLTGWFSGLSVGGGVYDIMLDELSGYQGEFQAYSVIGGYAHPINKSGNLRMEYELGLGFLSTGYVKYWWDGFDYSLIAPSPQSWRTNWIGPTKLQVSLVYYLKIRSKVGGRE